MSSTDNSSSSAKTYFLMSSDKETFEVEEAVAVQSETIKHMIDDGCFEPAIPLANVSSKILSKVIEYCKRHVDAPAGNPAAQGRSAAEELKAFDAEFVKVDQETLFDIILAANYLDMKNLLDLACQTVADTIKDMSPEEIRTTFNIKNDYTPEEEAEVRREHAWAFDE